MDAIRFTQGAVAKKDFVPALKHFLIQDGRIYGSNGNISLSAPIDMKVTCAPEGVAFVKAIQQCTEDIQLSLTKAGRLSVKSGKFKASINCIDVEDYVLQEPEGLVLPLGQEGSMVKALKVLAPFIAVDASRPWARGILFKGQQAFATNNIIIIQYWLPVVIPSNINIPEAAIKEIIRIGEDPISIQVTDTSVTFHYKGDRWLKSNLCSTDWPDAVDRILNADNAPPVDHTVMIDSLESLKPFLNKGEQLYLGNGMLYTSIHEDEGATVDYPPLKDSPVISFNLNQLLKVLEAGATIDFSTYPKPCKFYGDRFRGAIVGMSV